MVNEKTYLTDEPKTKNKNNFYYFFEENSGYSILFANSDLTSFKEELSRVLGKTPPLSKLFFIRNGALEKEKIIFKNNLEHKKWLDCVEHEIINFFTGITHKKDNYIIFLYHSIVSL